MAYVKTFSGLLKKEPNLTDNLITTAQEFTDAIDISVEVHLLVESGSAAKLEIIPIVAGKTAASSTTSSGKVTVTMNT